MTSIELRDPERREALRDYFLRLGAVSAIDARGFVNVSVVDDDLDVEESLRTWADLNDAPATILPLLSQPVGRADDV